MKSTVITLIALLSVSMLSVACSGGQMAEEPPSQPNPSETDVDEGMSEESIHVGIFVDNAFGDRAFFDIALDGVDLIKDEYNAEVTTYEGRLEPDNFGPILADAANTNKLVFVLGFEAIDAMLAAADENPDTLFVFIDAVIETDTVASLAYKDQEGCFVAGALAANMTSETQVENINEEKLIGFVGGIDAPVIQRCLSGYEQGAAYADPEVVVETVFVGSFSDPAKGKEANLALIEKGSDINYQYAGLSGEGGFNAAKEGNPMYTIGAGYDQRWLAPDQTIGSMMKRVDLSIEYLTGLYLDSALQPGDVFHWGLVEGGVPFTFSEDLVPAEVLEAANAAQEAVASGQITVEE